MDIIALTDRMELYGANLGSPHTKAFGNGLFELRLKREDASAVINQRLHKIQDTLFNLFLIRVNINNVTKHPIKSANKSSIPG